MTNNELSTHMYQSYVSISWCPADLLSLRPEWSEEKCMQVLDDVSKTLEDRSIESGWDILDTLVSYYD